MKIPFTVLLLAASGVLAQSTNNVAVAPAAAATKETTVTVVIETSLGSITAELYPDKAPGTVSNFLTYVNDKFFDGTVFHRVIPNFMIQGGGFTAEFQQKGTKPAIKNEADNGLKNDRGTFAMARTPVVDSATAQFFINLKDNDFLNFRDKSTRGYGYTSFGKVVDGMDVVDKIAAVKTGAGGPFSTDVPQPLVTIKSIRVKAAAAK